MLTDGEANNDRAASLPESAAAMAVIPGTWIPLRSAGSLERHPRLYAWPVTDFDSVSVRSPIAHSLDRGLVLLGASGVVLAAIFLALVLPGTSIAWIYLLAVVVFWLFLAAGLLAWHRRPSNGMGTLIVLGGFALYLGILADTGVPVLVVVSEVCATLILAVIFHLLHAFPSGRLRGRFSRATVIAGYVVCVVLQAPLYLFNPQNEVHAIVIADRADLVTAGIWLQRGAGLLVTAATVAVLVSRIVRSHATRRRVLIPLFGYGIFAVLFGPFGPLLLRSIPGISPLTGVVMQLLVSAGVPIAFSLGVLRGGFARTSELQELGSWLGAAGTARPALASAVARTLGDSTLRVVFWVDERNTFVDEDGVAATLPPDGSGRGVANVELDGRLVGAIEYDSVLIADPALVRTAGRVVAIAVDRERLTAELLASQRELRRSRSRLIEAAELERRRIARDLHDGLQVQLVLLAMKAGALAHAVGVPDPYREGATALRLGIDTAAGELRELVHAVMPSTLIEHGLSAATEDLVDRMPVPTRLELGVEDGSLPPMVESAAYFVLTEGLANALKHSRATECAVRLTCADDRLYIEVQDNGVGGAAFEDGTGLSGLSDRIDALGGALRIDSPPGSGTRLLVELPCEL
jgi:signal transduction histidine kinase